MLSTLEFSNQGFSNPNQGVTWVCLCSPHSRRSIFPIFSGLALQVRSRNIEMEKKEQDSTLLPMDRVSSTPRSRHCQFVKCICPSQTSSAISDGRAVSMDIDINGFHSDCEGAGNPAREPLRSVQGGNELDPHCHDIFCLLWVRVLVRKRAHEQRLELMGLMFCFARPGF